MDVRILLFAILLKVGCDGVLGSNKKLDKCGLCGGNNTTCHIVSGIFTRTKLPYGYSTLTTIPVGSCQINITEMFPSRNYLALKYTDGNYIINGNWALGYSNDYTGAGTVFKYHRPLHNERSSGKENIYAEGPTNTSVDIIVFKQEENKGVLYSYSIPMKKEAAPGATQARGPLTLKTTNTDPKADTPGEKPSAGVQKDEHANRGRQHTGQEENSAYAQAFLGNYQRKRPVTAQRGASPPRPSNPRPSNPRASNPRASNPRPSNPRPSHPRPSDPRSSHHQSRGSLANRRVLPIAQTNPRAATPGGRQPVPDARQPGTHRRRLRHHHNRRRRPSTVDARRQPVIQPPPVPVSAVQQPGGRYPPSQQALYQQQYPQPADPYRQPVPPGVATQAQSGGQTRYVVDPRRRHRYPPQQGTHNYQYPPVAHRPLSPNQHQILPVYRSPQPYPAPPGYPGVAPHPGVAKYPQAHTGSKVYVAPPYNQQHVAPNYNAQNAYYKNGRGTVNDQIASVALSRDRQTQLANSQTGSEYSWKISGFTECTSSCGGGTQQTRIVCVKGGTPYAVVTDENCDNVLKPKSQTLACNDRPCPPAWDIGQWGECSTTCDPGQQTRSVSCKQRVSDGVSILKSASLCQNTRKPHPSRKCNTDKPCVHWKIGSWSKCGTACGRGQRTREVVCVNADGHTIPENKCKTQRPKTSEICDMGSCAKTWFYTSWTEECSSSCGEGFYTRQVYCSDTQHKCKAVGRPRKEKRCQNDLPCGGKWFTGPWSECTANCGNGTEKRDVTCMKKLGRLLAVVGEDNCLQRERPETEKPCSRPACKSEWYMTDWTECSKSCDAGFRTRETKCLSAKQEPTNTCDLTKKPETRKSCNTMPCPTSIPGKQDKSYPSCQDKFRNCRLVVQANMCRYAYYKNICCFSCTSHGSNHHSHNHHHKHQPKPKT